MRKLLFLTIISSLLFSNAAFAQQGILPTGPEVSAGGCKEFIQNNKDAYSNEKKFKESYGKALTLGEKSRGSFLGCAISHGKIRLYMVPFFITYLIQFLLSIAGIVAVLFVVLGGFKYVVGGLIEEKEQGKKYIQNALIGLVVALSAWLVVNFVQVALTR